MNTSYLNETYLQESLNVCIGNFSTYVVTFSQLILCTYYHCIHLAKHCPPITGKVRHNQRTRRTRFTFSSDPEDSFSVTYECKLDGRKYKKCELK